MRGGAMIIEGDTVSDVGIYMRGGTIDIMGDAGSRIGCHMSGGSITVGGNARDVGLAMEGGHITVKTHADLIGEGMRGGEISLEGTYGKVGQVSLGTISHKGEPVKKTEFKDRVFFWMKQYLKTFKLLITSPMFTMRYIATLSYAAVRCPYRFVKRKLQTAGDYARSKLTKEGEIDEGS
jgi:formylmethanofuran dehydrogenase subunit C